MLIFEEWLQKLNRHMHHQNRSIILLCDNATSHISLPLSNIQLVYLPSNTTSHIQPMDPGIIRNFKLHCRKLQTRHYIRCVESEEPLKIDVRTALEMIKTSWSDVTPTTITNCWKHTGIVQPSIPESAHKPTDPDEDLSLMNLLGRDVSLLASRIDMIPSHKMSAQELIEIDSNIEVAPPLSEGESLELVADNDADSETSECESDNEKEPVSLHKVSS